jgi:LysM repeat protein
MKTRSVVLGVHIAALCAFTLTQGCVTSESEGNAIGAVHKGPFRHVRKGNSSSQDMNPVAQPLDFGNDFGMEPLYPVKNPIVSSPMDTPANPIKVSTTERYIVCKGDTLSQLAVDFDTTTAELVRLNTLANPDVLYVGQELTVPAGRSIKSAAAAKKSSSAVKGGGTYTIQKGDTLSEIASAAGVSIDQLRALNNVKGDMIMAGEELTIPAGGKVPATTKQSTAKTSTPKKSTPATQPVLKAPAPAAPALALPQMAPVSDVVEAPEGTTPSAAFELIEERIYYPGESLDDIAREYGVSKAEIMRLNGISDESQIKDGQRLRIPIAE